MFIPVPGLLRHLTFDRDLRRNLLPSSGLARSSIRNPSTARSPAVS